MTVAVGAIDEIIVKIRAFTRTLYSEERVSLYGHEQHQDADLVWQRCSHGVRNHSEQSDERSLHGV